MKSEINHVKIRKQNMKFIGTPPQILQKGKSPRIYFTIFFEPEWTPDRKLTRPGGRVTETHASGWTRDRKLTRLGGRVTETRASG